MQVLAASRQLLSWPPSYPAPFAGVVYARLFEAFGLTFVNVAADHEREISGLLGETGDWERALSCDGDGIRTRGPAANDNSCFLHSISAISDHPNSLVALKGTTTTKTDRCVDGG